MTQDFGDGQRKDWKVFFGGTEVGSVRQGPPGRGQRIKVETYSGRHK